MASLARRIRALEGLYRKSACPECGGGGGDDFQPGDSYELVFVDPDDPEDEPCPECGREPVVISLPEDSERRR